MLPEFALLPGIFDQASHVGDIELRDCLRELGSNLLPKTAVWPAVIADLHGGTWWQQVEPELRALTQTPAGALLRNLLERLPQLLVRRPACQNWPDSDAGWLEEACQTHRVFPLNRVVTSESQFSTLAADFQTPDKPRVGSLSSIFAPGYWDEVQPHASPEMNIARQVDALRSIAVYSDVVHFLNPYIGGGDGRKREIDFAIALLQAVYRRPTTFAPNPSFVLHTLGIKDNPTTADGARRLAGRARGICEVIAPQLPRGRTAQLILWPEFLERHVIGCERVEGGDGAFRERPRWGVHLGHVARTGDSSDMEETRWRLLDAGELGRLFERYGRQRQKPQLVETISRTP